MPAALALKQAPRAVPYHVVRLAVAARAAKASGPTRGLERLGALRFGAEAARDLGQRHAGLELEVQQLGDVMILDVRSDGKAEKLWRRFGFQEYGRMEDYARVRRRIITGYYLRAYIKNIQLHRQTNGRYWHRP
jgi:hypothetical protein